MTSQSSDELALWRAVISQAMDDVALRDIGAKRKARLWFKHAGADFRYVCSLADLDRDHVRMLALKRIAEADANPQPTRVCCRKPSVEPRCYEHGGKSLTVRQWAEELGVALTAMQSRIARLNKGQLPPEMVFVGYEKQPQTAKTDRGAGQDFSLVSGTGGGSVAQDRPFPEVAGAL